MSELENSSVFKEPILKSRRQRDVANICLLLFLALLGWFSFYWMSIAPAKRWEQVRNWPSTPCVIVRSEFETLRYSDSDDSCGALISYDYRVAGQQYTGDQFSNRGNTHSGDSAFYRARVASYPVSSVATCYVNPADPKDAILNKAEPETMGGWFGLLALPLGIWVWFSHLANERRLASNNP